MKDGTQNWGETNRAWNVVEFNFCDRHSSQVEKGSVSNLEWILPDGNLNFICTLTDVKMGNRKSIAFKVFQIKTSILFTDPT